MALCATNIKLPHAAAPRRATAASRFAAPARRGALQVRRAADDKPRADQQQAVTGIVFQPFEEVVPQLRQLDSLIEKGDSTTSLARSDYAEKLEAAVNEQINIEYNMSYIYHSLASYYDRDNVALLGFAAHYREQSEDERKHAQLLIEHQNRRGGRVKLQTILGPEAEFGHDTKGEALFGAEIALSLEKLNFQKLRDLHAVASEAGDSEFCHFIEDYLLDSQAREVKEAANMVTDLRRVGKGHGTWHIDQELREKHGVGAA